MYELKELIKQGILLVIAVVLARFAWQIVAPAFIDLWTNSFVPWLSDTISATAYRFAHPAHPETLPFFIVMMAIAGIAMLAVAGWAIAEWISMELYMRKRRKHYLETTVTQDGEPDKEKPEPEAAE